MKSLQFLTRWFESWISLEGSLSLSLPPGSDPLSLAGDEVISAILHHERR